MIVVFNQRCSKCQQLDKAFDEAGLTWEPLSYLEGDLTVDVLDQIFDSYTGDRADLIRTKEPVWKESGHSLDGIELVELKAFVLENPVVLQRPIVISDVGVVVARSPEALEGLLGG